MATLELTMRIIVQLPHRAHSTRTPWLRRIKRLLLIDTRTLDLRLKSLPEVAILGNVDTQSIVLSRSAKNCTMNSMCQKIGTKVGVYKRYWQCTRERGWLSEVGKGAHAGCR
jgi:hypothetical protein